MSFNHLCDLYSPSRTLAADGKPGAEQFQLAYTNVRCRREATPNLSMLTPFGRVQAQSLLTIEQWHFAEDQEIEDGWALIDRTILPDGSRGSSWGRIWRVRSQPERFVRSEFRDGGKQIVKASEEKELPIGVPV